MADPGLDELLRVERELARRLEAARKEAEAIEARARRDAETLRETRRAELVAELELLDAEAEHDLDAELSALEEEHGELIDRYRAVERDRLEELARRVVERILTDLGEHAP